MSDDVLKKIYAAKAARLAVEMERESYELLRDRAIERKGGRRKFVSALRSARGMGIVAEIKRASPSAGLIARNFDPVAIATMYERAGVDAISVLTEEDHFLGDLAYLDQVRAVSTRPLLRKDFIWSRYQVAQSAAHGADCILLIAGGLTDEQLQECLGEAQAYDLDVLVEVHNQADLRRAHAFDARFIGVNNRNLRTMTTDLAVSEHLLPQVAAEAFAISESGMRDRDDLERLRKAGAKGFLIGEALMRAGDPAALIAELKGATASSTAS